MRLPMIFATGALAAALTSTTASAQGTDADKRETAKMAYGAGQKSYEAGKYDQAASSFELAYESLPLPDLAFSAAQAHRLAYAADDDPQRVARALELYRAYLATAPDGKRRPDATGFIDKLGPIYEDLVQRGKIRDDKLAASTTKLTAFVSGPTNAVVTIDGTPVKSGEWQDALPGEHEIVVEAPGWQTYRNKITLTTGARQGVAVNMIALPARLAIKTSAGATVSIDGRVVLLRDGQTPTEHGKRLVTITARGKRPVVREVEVMPGDELTLDAPLASTGQRKAARWVAVGGGAMWLATGGAAALAFVHQGRASDLVAQSQADNSLSPADEARYQDELDARDRWKRNATWIGVAALVTSGAAAAMYYFDNPSPDQAPVMEQRPSEGPSFAPMANLDGGDPTVGLSLQGGF